VVGHVRPEVGLLRLRRGLAAALLALAGCRSGTSLPVAAATEAVGEDADDPALWIDRRDPASSRLLATNKAAAPRGALVVFDLAGRMLQRIDGLDRPNNVDVEYGVRLAGAPADVAVATERYRRRLRAWRLPAGGGPLEELAPAGGLPVFEGEPGERGAPMGVALYRRPSDGAAFAFVSRKQGPASGYLWQYRLDDDGAGGLRAVKVRELGQVEAGAEVEAVLVDDALGYVYYAEERRGIHKWRADPDAPDAARELAVFGTEGFRGDREGLALYARPDGTGYLIAADQLPGRSRYLVFRREGRPGDPHDHSGPPRVLEGGADATDGLDATSQPLGPGFPAGLLVAMNSAGCNFLLYRWDALGID